MKNVLPQIISKEQTCSIPNRTIFNNLFLIRDTITLTKEKNNTLYLLQIDQEKAFDKIDHDFLYKTMTKMGFSNTFVQFIKILYQNNSSFIANNGFLSTPIRLERGLRQGCPLSLPLYVIQGEVTTININNNQNIKGIKTPNNNREVKISQYSGDSNFLLTEQKSIEPVTDFFEKLNKATINLEKTLVLPINTDQTTEIQKLEKKHKNTTTVPIYRHPWHKFLRRLKRKNSVQLAKHSNKNGKPYTKNVNQTTFTVWKVNSNKYINFSQNNLLK